VCRASVDDAGGPVEDRVADDEPAEDPAAPHECGCLHGLAEGSDAEGNDHEDDVDRLHGVCARSGDRFEVSEDSSDDHEECGGDHQIALVAGGIAWGLVGGAHVYSFGFEVRGWFLTRKSRCLDYGCRVLQKTNNRSLYWLIATPNQLLLKKYVIPDRITG